MTYSWIKEATSWLKEAAQLEADGKHEEALDLIFNNFDQWLLDGEFSKCSLVLKDAAVECISTAQLLTILTATLPASSKLPHHTLFYSAVFKELRKRGEDADSLMSGLLGVVADSEKRTHG